MKNYLVYKEQIQGFNEVSEAVKTVEKIAAASISKLRKQVADLDAYQSYLRGVLDRLSLFHEEEKRAKSRGQNVLVVLTSDKGLTGGLWRRMIDEFLKSAQGKYQVVLPIGSKGEKYLKEEKIVVESAMAAKVSADGDAIKYLLDGFNKGTFAQIDILYPKFISLAQHQPTVVPFLPFKLEKPSSAAVSASSTKMTNFGLPVIEPAGSRARIFDGLMQKYIKAYFKKITAEGKLSEFAARTLSMEHAGFKTDEIVKGLNLTFRKERRRSLTQKQLESFISNKIMKIV